MRSDLAFVPGLIDAILDSWRRGLSWRGRSTRTQLFLFHLITAVISYCVFDLAGVETMIEWYGAEQFMPAGMAPEWNWRTIGALVFSIITILPNWMLSVRRLHDSNKSGMWLLIALIPIIGVIVIFILMLLPGTTRDNGYGHNPRFVEGPVPTEF